MRSASHHEPHAELGMHDHAMCAYDTLEDLVPPLREFLDGGLSRDQVCVLVHSFDADEHAWALLEAARPDARRLASDRLIVVSFYQHAFQGEKPRIDHEHVTRVVDDLISAADAAGRAGVRIFVDASRRYLAQERVAEWFRFEEWLGPRLQHRAGLVCAYQRTQVMRPDILLRMLDSHAYRFGGPDATRL